MARSLVKTAIRSRDFLSRALVWQEPHKEYLLVGWALVVGAIWLAAGLLVDPRGLAVVFWGIYLFGLLTAICATDARFGIIPDSLVAWLAIGGAIQLIRSDWQNCEQALLASIFAFMMLGFLRAAYRYLRGHDGLGFGDVKFLAAGALWVGLEGLASVLVIAVASALAGLVVLRLNGVGLSRTYSMSFGPHLAAAIWIVWIFDPLELIAH